MHTKHTGRVHLTSPALSHTALWIISCCRCEKSTHTNTHTPHILHTSFSHVPAHSWPSLGVNFLGASIWLGGGAWLTWTRGKTTSQWQEITWKFPCGTGNAETLDTYSQDVELPGPGIENGVSCTTWYVAAPPAKSAQRELVERLRREGPKSTRIETPVIRESTTSVGQTSWCKPSGAHWILRS